MLTGFEFSARIAKKSPASKFARTPPVRIVNTFGQITSFFMSKTNWHAAHDAKIPQKRAIAAAPPPMTTERNTKLVRIVARSAPIVFRTHASNRRACSSNAADPIKTKNPVKRVIPAP